MCAEAAASVHFRRSHAATLADALDQVDERQMKLGQVHDLGGPVVHLRIDVDGVFAAPGRPGVRTPDALKVQGQGAGAAATDGQVATEIEIEDGERRILLQIAGIFLGACQTYVGAGYVCFLCFVVCHTQVYAIVQCAEIVCMGL